jgi:hypothetical protein
MVSGYFLTGGQKGCCPRIRCIKIEGMLVIIVSEHSPKTDNLQQNKQKQISLTQ